MANYKVNTKAKSIIVSGELTDIEISIVSAYITKGYTVKEKKKSTTRRVGYDDIKKFYEKEVENKEEEAKNKKVLADFNKKKGEKTKDKNGKDRKEGFLGAMSWFKENHWDDYAVIYKEVTGKEATKTAKKEAETK